MERDRYSANGSPSGETESIFHLLFERSAEAMSLFDPQSGRFIEANDAVVRQLGAPGKEALGSVDHDSGDLGMWLNLDDRAKFLADLQRDGSLSEVECQVRSQRGSVHTMLLEFKTEPLELGMFARRLVDEVLSATDRRCPIEFLLAEMPGKVLVDERLPRHIFTNLLTNAVKYSAAGQAVQFEFVCDRAGIVCTIRDRSTGIPEADREWLFNAFHRARNVGDRPGTGLGLVIVKRCVDLHGGEIKVDSKLGEGTLVTLSLPIFSPESTVAGDLAKPR